MGRFGDNGFNIRGIEGDRVAMTIDGLSMAEGLETARSYEFFRAGRGGVDIDTLKRVEIVKGADSITAGSGALGGAVVFTTKAPSDYLAADGTATHVDMKIGYTGHNPKSTTTTRLSPPTAIVHSNPAHTRTRPNQPEVGERTNDAH